MNKYLLPQVSIVDRFQWILTLASRQRCLHVGCADSPYYKTQFEQGRLLHSKLDAVVTELFGVDLSTEGVSFLHSIGFSNVFVGNIENLESVPGLSGKRFDIIVAGEIVEHLGNPVLALVELGQYLSPNGSILITVPNAFSFKSFLRVLLGRELVHPDHLCYYSMVTVQNLVKRAGLQVDEIRPYVTPTESSFMWVPWFISRFVASLSPWIADGLVVRVSR